MADRFHCPDLDPGGHAVLQGPEAHHLARVRRVGVGEQVELFDGLGRGCLAEVRYLGKDEVRLDVLSWIADRRQAPVELTLAVAPPKGDRLDWLVEKATELGVARLLLVRADRTTVDPRAAKLDRLRRAVVEASKQCGRFRLMEVTGPLPFEQVLHASSALRWIAHPGGLPPAAWPNLEAAGGATLLVGPEGGFTPAEVESALAAGWLTVGLGPTLLRIETAALAGAALVLGRVQEDTPR